MPGDKKSAADLRKELRELRKTHSDYKPISKLKVGDISAEIERLRQGREETPAVAAVPSSKPRGLAPSVESIKKAKASEFPVRPGSEVSSGKAVKAPEKKKSTKMDKLMKMLEELTDSESD